MTRSCGGSGVLDPCAAHKAHLMPPQQSGCVCTMLGDNRQKTEEAAAMDSRSQPFAVPISHPSCHGAYGRQRHVETSGVSEGFRSQSGSEHGLPESTFRPPRFWLSSRKNSLSSRLKARHIEYMYSCYLNTGPARSAPLSIYGKNRPSLCSF